MAEHRYTNALIHSSSPYLQQHAHNPVNWREWGEEVFKDAKAQDKLVLVSIGYSACHWCHVMEKECFENEATAALMNEHFFCIKVDREERPDVDQVYMDAVQLISGHGGWPLNMFTLPDGRPLHGGTYFPKPQWDQLLFQLAEFYKTRKNEAEEFAERLTGGIRSLDLSNIGGAHDLPATDSLFEVWEKSFDWQEGGYTRAPKFPLPNNYLYLLQYAHLSSKKEALDFTLLTLIKMAQGGIYDQLGGGFARYSVDALWFVPHFEKMLYDNAQLISLYAHSARKTGLQFFQSIANECCAFVLKELTDQSGAFYSALDADSEGIEGKYYVWSKAELQELLGNEEEIFSGYYNVSPEGNWEHGINILHVKKPVGQLAAEKNISRDELVQKLEKSKLLLLKERQKRVRPGLDDKCLASWNGLMLTAFCDAWLADPRPEFMEAATKNAEIIRNSFFQNGRLQRVWKNGKASVNGFSEDYACVAEAFISLYEITFDEDHLLFARQLTDICLEQYYEEEKGFFAFTSKEDPELIARKTDITDDVIPSSNSILAHNLYKLGLCFTNSSYLLKADRMLALLSDQISKSPAWYSNWSRLVLYKEKGVYEIVVTGPRADENVMELRKVYIPNAIILRASNSGLIPILEGRYDSEVDQIYVCRDTECLMPVRTVSEALTLLGK